MNFKEIKHPWDSSTYEFEEELLNVKGGKQLTLPVNDDLSGRLAWNRLVWLHDFRIDVGNVGSLLGVVALVDGVGAVEVFAHDLPEELLTLHGGLCIVAGLDLPLDPDGAGLLLDLVDFAQGGSIRSKGRYFLKHGQAEQSG